MVRDPERQHEMKQLCSWLVTVYNNSFLLPFLRITIAGGALDGQAQQSVQDTNID